VTYTLQLVPSGGWLGDVVTLLSTYTGIWDAFLLVILFIVSWVVLRTSPVEVSLVLSHVFDLTIPLQHHCECAFLPPAFTSMYEKQASRTCTCTVRGNDDAVSENKNVKALHQNHLDQYWPFFLFGTGVQVGAFFLVHPELFTLIVCFKTTALTVLWLGRKQNGQFVGIQYEYWTRHRRGVSCVHRMWGRSLIVLVVDIVDREEVESALDSLEFFVKK
jgi:hypothetical protein